MALRVGALTVVRLGLPQPSRPHFHDANQIRPLGFSSRRRFHDVSRADGRASYLCEVRESNGLPSFVIQHEADPSLSFRGRSPLEAYQALLRRYRASPSYRNTPPLSSQRQLLEAAVFFGFGLPAVAQLIEQLPGAKSCEGFTPRYARAESSAPPPPRSEFGAARADPIVRRSSAFKAAHHVYYRPFINRGELGARERRGGEEEVRGESVHLRKRDVVERPLGFGIGTQARGSA